MSQRRRVVPGMCPRCFSKATLQCSKCKAVSYCCKEHQMKDWALGHKAECGLNLPTPPRTMRPHTTDGAQCVSDEDWELVSRHSQTPLPLVGLHNTGNTCYANSVLQCMMRIPALHASGVLAPEAETQESGRATTFTGEFFSLVKQISALAAPRAGRGEPVLAPNGVTAWLPELDDQFNYGQQEDSHEFLQAVMRMMDHEAVKAAGGDVGARVDEESTLARRIFGGQMAHQIQCTKCYKASTSFEPFMNLCLEITGVTDTLGEQLELFTAPEKLDKENKFECSGCEKKVRMQKQIFIDEAPLCLVVSIKRFHSASFYGKVNKHVQVPLELNLRPYMSPGTDGDATYNLSAVLVHLDKFNIASYGHYIAYVRRGDKWFRMDDSTVSEVSAEEVLGQSVYMLFYNRAGAGAGARGGGGGGGAGGGAAMSRSSSASGLARKASGLSLSGMSLSASRGSLEGLDAAEGDEGGKEGGAPGLCKGGCGFYGSYQGFCSKCYAEKFGKPPPAPPKNEGSSGSSPTGKGAGGGDGGAGAGGGGAAAGGKAGGGEGRGKAGGGLPPPAPPKKGPEAKAKAEAKLGPNSPCPCGSGKKFKKCHMK